MPKEILTLLISALPIVELRGAIPLAILKWGIHPALALFLSIIGSFLPVLPILFLLRIVSEWLSVRSPRFHKMFCWFCEKTEAKNRKIFERWSGAAIFIISAIPFPLFGAWSGALAAFVTRTPIKKAGWLILAGTIVAGVVVVFLTLGGRLALE